MVLGTRGTLGTNHRRATRAYAACTRNLHADLRSHRDFAVRERASYDGHNPPASMPRPSQVAEDEEQQRQEGVGGGTPIGRPRLGPSIGRIPPSKPEPDLKAASWDVCRVLPQETARRDDMGRIRREGGVEGEGEGKAWRFARQR
jgi:hypothetical protein